MSNYEDKSLKTVIINYNEDTISELSETTENYNYKPILENDEGFKYTKVIYPINKTELFDEDNIKYLLNDTRFNKEDRNKLSNYNKHRISGSRINTSYKFGLGCEELQLGRLFPEDCIGLQSFRFDIRNVLTKKWYWDLDVENAHYIIAYKYCKDYGLNYNYIEEYIKNRENILKMVSKSRKKAKTEFLKTLYLGNIKLYNANFNEIDGEITNEGYEFIKNLSKQIETLATVIWDKHQYLHKIKIGKENKAINKRTNPKASLMSLIFQTDEREILMVFDAFLKYKNRTLGVLIHDGGLVEKLEKEEEFPKEILKEAEKEILKYTGFDVILTQKEINYEWEPFKPQTTQYEIIKKRFEEKAFLVGSLIYVIHDDGHTEYLKFSDAKIKYAPLKVDLWNNQTDKMETKKFLDIWIEDQNRRSYDRVDFYPDINNCPETIYNLFKGFNAEKYIPLKPLTNLEQRILVQPIIEHLNYLTKGYANYILKWFANIIQNPQKKSEVSILIRDQGDMLTEGGGIGKNLIIEFFGYKILGKDYCIVIGDNKELYSNFNSIF